MDKILTDWSSLAWLHENIVISAADQYDGWPLVAHPEIKPMFAIREIVYRHRGYQTMALSALAFYFVPGDPLRGGETDWRTWFLFALGSVLWIVAINYFDESRRVRRLILESTPPMQDLEK